LMTDERLRVAWRDLVRKVRHRTSGPTNVTLSQAIGRIARAREGLPFARPSADTVIYAALRRASRNPAERDALLAEVNLVEGMTFLAAEAVEPVDEE